jgi:site-specific DNA recombinase
MEHLKGKTALTYRRVSTTDQKLHGNSLNSQRRRLNTFCDNNGIVVLREFEEDCSAKNFERPVIQELIKFAKSNKNKIDYILVTDWDRFSRNTFKGLEAINLMLGMGIEVNAIEEWQDPDSPSNVFMRVIHLAMSEQENAHKSNRVKHGMRQGLKEGRYNGKQPIGYLPGRDEEDRVLMQPDELKGPLITQLFNVFSNGLVNQNQILNNKTYAPLGLNRSSLSRVLRNQLYAGYVKVPKTKKEPQELVLGLHEPLVSLDVYRDVQRVLDNRIPKRQAPKELSNMLPLRGVIDCPECNKTLTGSGSRSKTGKRHFYYHCNTKSGCGYRIKVESCHQAVEDLLDSLRPPKEVVALFKAVLEDKFRKDNKTAENELKRVLEAIKTVNRRKAMLTTKLLDQVLSDNIYTTSLVELEREEAELDFKKSNLLKPDSRLKDFVQFGLFLLNNLKDVYSKSSPDTKIKCMSSILGSNLIIQKGKCRTPQFKEGFGLIYSETRSLQRLKTKTRGNLSNVSRLVPEVGIEPTLLAEHEFESCASTSSAIRANGDDKSNVARVVSYNF